jgi:dynein heavy chain 2
MPTGDSRKDYILATTANYFGVGVADAAITALHDSTALNSFLDDGNIDLCAGRIETRGNAKRLAFSNKVQFNQNFLLIN